FPEISAPILDRKIKNIEESGADLVCMDCPGCLMQIGGGLDKQESKVKAKHTAQILAERLTGK
ncbi:MAG TPA: (Fe-S)-binding protein, partial [Candidatus Deferrimicrobium sp.]|nr:(Fe-S)-binding protein [Candidatus Deferrimicrobium sp.]